MPKQIYNQSGGFIGALVMILKFIITTVIKIFIFIIIPILKPFFRIWPKTDEMNEPYNVVNFEKKWNIGYFWIYAKWCIKVIIYLILFCFGGPIVMMAGIIYLYSKLGSKLAIRSKSLEQQNSINI
jgi:hypothetical protein